MAKHLGVDHANCQMDGPKIRNQMILVLNNILKTKTIVALIKSDLTTKNLSHICKTLIMGEDFNYEY